METRKIGSLEVSVVGLGTNNFGSRLDERATAQVLDGALDFGVNFIDTADVYGATQSETFIGNLLGARRSKVVLATKFGMPVGGFPAGGSPSYVRQALDASLGRLKTEYIDLYIYHRPDPDTPIGETLAALDEAVREGKVREIGCSNFSVEQLREAEAKTREGAARFVNLQNNYSLLHREPEAGVLGECVRQSIGFVPFWPLAAGLLTGKYRKGAPVPGGTRIAKMTDERRQDALSEHNLEIVEQLIAFAKGQGHSLLDLAFSWLLSQPSVVSVIAGASNREQMKANAESVPWEMTSDELEMVDRILAA
ncbi:MAG TPA: aldo/keto reductase [Acidimicrobiales bacterium]|nr:aldo/keto reductase [Acidimicrobiales bacterium]